MEITCNVLKRSSSIQINYKTKTKKFKNLNLESMSKKCNMTSFIKTISSEKYVCVSMDFIKEYFDNVNEDIGLAVLMTYYISSYANHIFGLYKTKFDQKLLCAANQVILSIENMSIDFPNIFDNYYSLYKTWKSKDSITEMNNLFEHIYEIAKGIQIQKTKNNNYDTSHLIKLMDNLFDFNSKYASKIILHNYELFDGLSEFKSHFWEKIKLTYKNDKDTLFVIIITELKIKLIPLLLNPVDRKEIYYGLDTENIINKIRTSEFDNAKKMEIINILQNKIKKINEKYIPDSTNNIISLFENMFEYIFN